MNLKNLIHRNTIARYNYAEKFAPIGITFEEYCDYIYKGARENESNFAVSNVYGVAINRVGTYSFIQNVEEVLIDEVYKFKSDTDSPYIIDCGINIGLSVIYFKKLFPNSKVIGFEPDEKIYQVCSNNLMAFKFSNIQLENAAVWKEDGELNFLPDNSLGGMIADGTKANSKINRVKAIRLKKYLDVQVDFLKIDIEGAELEVLQDCKNELCNVKTMFVEYHSSTSKPQELDKLLRILTDSGFRYYIKHAWDYMKHPFVDHIAWQAKGLMNDLQLNIFAYRL